MERAPKGLVIDASVAAKWFIPEKDSDKASKIMRRYSEGIMELYAPDLLICEVANVLRYRPDIADEAIDGNIDSLFKLQLNLIPPSSEILSRAATKARELDLSVYDACYLVIAETLATNLITADMKFHERRRGEGLLFPLQGFRQRMGHRLAQGIWNQHVN